MLPLFLVDTLRIEFCAYLFFLGWGPQRQDTQHAHVVGNVEQFSDSSQGLFLGIELCDSELNPQTEKAAYLAKRMKELGILMSTDGKDVNVMKIKPPMVFSREHADQLLEALHRVCREDFMRLP